MNSAVKMGSSFVQWLEKAVVKPSEKVYNPTIWFEVILALLATRHTSLWGDAVINAISA
jgi:hypothetical protein